MKNRWSDSEALEAREKSGGASGDDLAPLTYLTNLLGRESDLALHGGGNTSVKGTVRSVFGEETNALFVKASGCDMAGIGPDGFVALDLDYLKKLQCLTALSDEEMAGQFRCRSLKPSTAQPSIETLMHAFITEKFVAHTHPSSILALTNRTGGEEAVRQACGTSVIVVPYVKVGFDLAARVAAAIEAAPQATGLVIAHHGLVTWGSSASEAYQRTIDVVSAAENFLERKKTRAITALSAPDRETARARYREAAPIIRGLLGDRHEQYGTGGGGILLKPLISEFVLNLIGSEQGKELALSVPITPDYLIRTKALPLWIDAPAFDNPAALRDQLTKALAEFSAEYKRYLGRGNHHDETAPGDLLPRLLVLPGLGIVCAGKTAAETAVVSDIAQQGFAVKAAIYETGGSYAGLSEEHLFDMEFRSYQRAKLDRTKPLPLSGTVALVTGSAGAIGTGICQSLLDAGCHVAVSDLAGKNIDGLVSGLSERYGDQVLGVALDVTDPESVAAGFGQVVSAWGGIDCVIVNAGIAHVSPLEEMELDAFRRLERVNVEGTLLCLKEAGRLFKIQSIGGDIVLISTKNVFAPGAKFGAYSATKAAAHQLARIASLELAPIGVRVNMVAPDAVFSHGATKSGLWAAVGPDRMRARGLDEAGLEEYYRQRNLLKAKVTAEHVANAVLFFITRQTPTTGATIPVDGGLPDATPR